MGNNRKKPDEVVKPELKKKLNSEMTDSERNRIKQENNAKANPEQAARNNEINDRKRLNRKESGSVKQLG